MKPRSHRQTCSALCYSAWRASLSDPETVSAPNDAQARDLYADFATADVEDFFGSGE